MHVTLKFLEVGTNNDSLISLISSDIWERATQQNTAKYEKQAQAKQIPKTPATQLTESEMFISLHMYMNMSHMNLVNTQWHLCTLFLPCLLWIIV